MRRRGGRGAACRRAWRRRGGRRRGGDGVVADGDVAEHGQCDRQPDAHRVRRNNETVVSCDTETLFFPIPPNSASNRRSHFDHARRVSSTAHADRRIKVKVRDSPIAVRDVTSPQRYTGTRMPCVSQTSVELVVLSKSKTPSCDIAPLYLVWSRKRQSIERRSHPEHL